VTPEEAAARIVALEEELTAAHKTIDALVRRSERPPDNSIAFSLFEATARFEQLAAARTRELAEKTRQLEEANAELQNVMTNLDQIVRQRTRALAYSEEKLLRKNAELDRLNAMKSEFIGVAAHELRTPMTAILGYAQMMAEQKICPLPEELVRPVASLNRNTQRLRRLIEDMLDVSRLERGKITLHVAAHDVGRLAESAVAELEVYASQYGHQVNLEHAVSPPVEVDGDKIHQVIVNLLGNAIKHTGRGGHIMVTTGTEDGYAAVRVKDDGAGIPAHIRERLFEPFSHYTEAKHHSSRGPDSAGLGLYIARGIIDLHGGEIRVVTQEGVGTEFIVLLPAAPSRPNPAPPEQPALPRSDG
jgi:signal transduction histidine kinase